MLSCDVLSCDDACAGDNSSTASTEPFGGARRAEVDPNKLAPRFSAPSGRAPFAQAGTVRAAGADSESAGLIAKKRSRSLGDSGPVSGRVGAADLTCGKCGREVTICLRVRARALFHALYREAERRCRTAMFCCRIFLPLRAAKNVS